MSWRAFTRPKSEAVYDYLLDCGYTLPLTAEQLGQRLHDLSMAEWEDAKRTWRGASLRQVWQQLLRELNLDPPKIDLDELLQAYNWEPFPGVDLFADTIPVLEKLRQEGYALGLITNAYHPMWMRDIELRHYGLLDYFPARITSGDTGYMKPHPAIFWRMLGMLWVEPAEAVFVGDRPENDIAGANEVGMISVFMNPPTISRELNGIQPTYTITSLGELLPLLAALNR